VASTHDQVCIYYRRPPDREQIFHQRVIHRTPHCVVTLLTHAEIAAPIVIAEREVLEPGAPVIWFTFPGAHHDIGRFHLADGTFTGLYANVLTPIDSLDAPEWRTTDLFLDVWLDPSGEALLLDEDELDAAEHAGWIDPAVAAGARTEARRILTAIRAGTWPPAIVGEWTLAAVEQKNDGRGRAKTT
jgi:predicted RNA-binding protein associated with RNAse of E/G family